MSNWAAAATANLVKNSMAKNLKDAMREWRTTGGFEDSHDTAEICELCEHEGLRYQFEIENRYTRRIMWVGSTCIVHFIPLYDKGVEIVGDEEKAGLLRRRQAEYAAQSREERARQVLQQLSVKEPAVYAQSGWFVNWARGYSAKQMVMLSAACKRHDIAFSSSDFRINTRRDNIVEQVRSLEPWQYRRLRGALPKSRHAEFDAHFRKLWRAKSSS